VYSIQPSWSPALMMSTNPDCVSTVLPPALNPDSVIGQSEPVVPIPNPMHLDVGGKEPLGVRAERDLDDHVVARCGVHLSTRDGVTVV
jgi:hypothetical protein